MGREGVYFFERDGDVWLPRQSGVGPCGPQWLHGGPVAALIVSIAEDLLPGERMLTTRLTLELVRPVPTKPLRASARLLKSGRRVNLIDVELEAEGKQVAIARVQRTAIEPVRLPPLEGTGVELAPPAVLPEDYPPMDLSQRQDQFTPSSFVTLSCEMRTPRPEGIFGREPTDAWLRVIADLAPGRPLSNAAAVCAAADCGNALGAPEAPGAGTRFANADLTVHLVREPVDRWVHMIPSTVWMDHGIGHTRCALADRRGMLGSATVVLPLSNLE